MAVAPSPATGAIVAACAIIAASQDTSPEIALEFLRSCAAATSKSAFTIGKLPRCLSHPGNSAQARLELMGVWQHATGFVDWTTAELWGQSPRKWGPVLWQALHDLSCFFSKRTRKTLLCLFDMLPAALPCSKCRRHSANHLVKMRRILRRARTRLQFIDAVIEFHNTTSMSIKGASTALYYPLLGDSERFRNGDGRVSTPDALVLLQNKGPSSSPNGTEEGDCGCAQRKVFASGKLV